MSNRHPGERGLSLIEIVVVVAVLVMIAGVLAPVVGTALQETKATRILAVAEAIEKACFEYHRDTGGYAIEYSGSSYTASQYHKLSAVQTIPGWDGPYLDQAVTTRDNPFGGFVYLYGNLTGGSARPDGFAPTGGEVVTGDGQFVGFGGVPESVAQMVDEAWDRDVPGDWKTNGRVEYSSANGGTVMLLLLHGSE